MPREVHGLWVDQTPDSAMKKQGKIKRHESEIKEKLECVWENDQKIKALSSKWSLILLLPSEIITKIFPN